MKAMLSSSWFLFSLGMSLCALQKAEASPPRMFLTSTLPNTNSNIRVAKEMGEGKEKKQVLVVDTTVPGGTTLEINLNAPLLYQWILNSRGQIVQQSMPYYHAQLLSFPEEAPIDPSEKERLRSQKFYMHITDIDPAKVVAATFDNELEEGATKPIVPLPWDSHNPKGTWAHAIQTALSQNSNQYLVKGPPRDIVDFCPRFSSLPEKERFAFWVLLINHISRFESLFIPYTASDEGTYDPANKGVISSGLTQISIASSKSACYQARGCNVIRVQEDLFHPEKNLRCAIGIMSCLAEQGSCVSCKQSGKWQGVAKYWSTMQEARQISCPTCPGGKVTIGKKAEIQEALRTSASFCF